MEEMNAGVEWLYEKHDMKLAPGKGPCLVIQCGGELASQRRLPSKSFELQLNACEHWQAFTQVAW